MTRKVAFLRGINLGSRRVKMARLRAAFEELDVEDVATYIASGNVIFRHEGDDRPALEARIEEHLAGALGFATDTFVRTLDELRDLLADDTLEEAEAEGFTPYVTFLEGDAGPEVARALAALETPDDRFLVRGDAVLWLRRGGMSDTSIATRDLDAAMGGGTRRKLDTVRRIVEKYTP